MSDELKPIDAEILRAWGSANFGPADKTPKGRMSLIVEALGKMARGYSPGFTIYEICRDLELIKVEPLRLSDRGLHWLCTYTNRQSIPVDDLLVEAEAVLRGMPESLRVLDEQNGPIGITAKWFEKRQALLTRLQERMKQEEES